MAVVGQPSLLFPPSIKYYYCIKLHFLDVCENWQALFLSISLYVWLCLCVCFCICLGMSVVVCLCMSVGLYVWLTLCVFASACPCLWKFVGLFMYVCTSVCRSVHLAVCLLVFLCMSVCVCLSICLSLFYGPLLCLQLEHGVRPHSKYLTEYFAFLLDFSKMGDEESLFMIHINAISTMINFYMGQKSQENYVSASGQFSLVIKYTAWEVYKAVCFHVAFLTPLAMSLISHKLLVKLYWASWKFLIRRIKLWWVVR